MGLAVIALAVLMVLQVVIIRWLARRHAKKMRRLKSFWRPLLAEAAIQGPPEQPPPALNERQWLEFFYLWNHLQTTLQGNATANLARFARRLGLHHIALRKLMRKSDLPTRLAAIIALGRTRDKRAWELLSTLLNDANPVTSFSAAQALARIDARRAMPEIIPHAACRDDWPRDHVANLLREAGPNATTHPLVDAILAARGATAAMLIRYLRFAHLYASNMIVHRLMLDGQDREILSACLQVAHGPSSLPLIREHLSHPDWAVKVEAANALGRLGGLEDIPALAALLTDREWWVRYRAAQALAGLPGLKKHALEEILNRQTDRYARDILIQVLAEKAAA